LPTSHKGRWQATEQGQWKGREPVRRVLAARRARGARSADSGYTAGRI